MADVTLAPEFELLKKDVGEWDADTPPSMANRIFPLLTKAREKRLVLLGRGTHTMALEAERHGLFAEVQRFFE